MWQRTTYKGKDLVPVGPSRGREGCSRGLLSQSLTSRSTEKPTCHGSCFKHHYSTLTVVPRHVWKYYKLARPSLCLERVSRLYSEFPLTRSSGPTEIRGKHGAQDGPHALASPPALLPNALGGGPHSS